MKMGFEPHRDLLMEFSGEIGNACWAGKEISNLESYPNFISLIMIQNPGNTNERVAGACFLIETKTENGDDLLVIRGLNPLENVINQLNYEDFFEKLTNYLLQVADKQKRKLAIVVDDHSGGSGTNRQQFYEQFFGDLRNKLEKVRISGTNTSFNGYNIVNDTYLIV